MADRLLTADDLLKPGAAALYEHCELWDGTLVVHEPAGGWAAEVGGRVHAALSAHVRPRRLGWVPNAEQGYFVSRRPDRVLAPDASFVSRERLPILPDPGFIPIAPDFAVEVRSPTDRWPDVLAKCGIWVAHGVREAWAVDPRARRVVVFRPGEASREAGPGDELDVSPAVPGFRVRVDDLFEDLDPPAPPSS